MSKIAKFLNAEKIPSPSEYYYKRIGKDNSVSCTKLWSKETIKRILSNPIYLGTLAQQRRTTVSYKNHKIVFKDKEDWVVVEDNHEPIISQELWDKVQEYNNSVSRGKSDKQGVTGTFSGLLYCADCGYKMKKKMMKSQGKTQRVSYTCGLHAYYGKENCTTHTISESVLEALVIADIQDKLRLIVDEEKARKEFLTKETGIRASQGASDKKRKNEIEKRLSELDTLTQSVYENMVLGKVPEDVCVRLIDKYQEENKTLQAELETVMARLDMINQDERDVDKFIRRLKRYAGFEVLSREMLIELVEYITVEDEPENRNIPRKIHIYYKFLDKALPDKRNALM